MHGRHFQNLYLIPPILFALFSSGPQTNAQQAGAHQASQPPDKQAFQQIEDRWSQAIAKRDQYALELVLSPELIDISAWGDQTTRNQQIAMLFEKDAEPLSLDPRVTNVRTFGEVAVVIGSYDEHLRVSGKPVRQTGMFTHIYHNERGNWFCVDAQRTPDAEPVPEKARGAAKHNHAEPVRFLKCSLVTKRHWADVSLSSIPAYPWGLHALGLSVRSGGPCMAKVPFRRYMEFDFRNEHPHCSLLGRACRDCASLQAHTVVDGACADTIRIAIPRHRVRGFDAVRDV
jgi:hypothetical protein